MSKIPKVKPVKSDYGFCPICGKRGMQRERRINGSDYCMNFHRYPSDTALKFSKDFKKVKATK